MKGSEQRTNEGTVINTMTERTQNTPNIYNVKYQRN